MSATRRVPGELAHEQARVGHLALRREPDAHPLSAAPPQCAVLPLQLLGFDVDPINSVQFRWGQSVTLVSHLAHQLQGAWRGAAAVPVEMQRAGQWASSRSCTLVVAGCSTGGRLVPFILRPNSLLNRPLRTLGSNHTGYPKWNGEVMSGDGLWRLVEGLDANGLVRHTHLLTGEPSAQHPQ